MKKLSHMAAAEASVLRAALAWWRKKRPEFFTTKDHIESPTYNCYASEINIARAVARLERMKKA